jgi:SNF2 family DNA or RNA helicase
MSYVLIDLGKDERGFTITCDINKNWFPRGLPSRRFNSRRKEWDAPAVKLNAKYIQEQMTEQVGVISTPAAQAKLNELNNPTRAPNGFPTWYPFKTTPYLAQQMALDKVYGLNGFALFMAMRTGKTKVAIDIISALRMENKIKAVVIVCPLPIRLNWVREFLVHSPIPIDVYLCDTGNIKRMQRWFETESDFKCLITGVESLSGGRAGLMTETFLKQFTGEAAVIVDESSTIKNHKSTWYKWCKIFSQHARYRGILTGSPMSLGPMDLFAQYEFLDTNIIGAGDFYTFRARYAVMGGFEGKKVVEYDRLDELSESIEPYTYQVKITDVFPDAPKKLYEVLEVNMTDTQRNLYKTVKSERELTIAEGKLIISSCLELMLRLQEITGGHVTVGSAENDPKVKYKRGRITGENPKLTKLMEVAEEIEGSIIVWCMFKDEIYLVEEALSKRYGVDQVVSFHGDIDEYTRIEALNSRFQTGKAKFLVGNTAVGAMGLTMTKADTIIYYSNSFRYVDRVQSEERAFDPKKTSGTRIIDLVMAHSVDVTIMKSLINKKDISDYVTQCIDEAGNLKLLFDGVE